ncbi:MAG: T9SS type A sorting domain-containing protein [Saprospiraceae bacterium]|nr:T9SS type A sorting domain-containing protein [Saprospiraceae bacterium]
MKKFYVILVFFLLFPFLGIAQCPEVRFIMVDACTGTGNEQDNEFFVLNSGAGFNVDDLGFTTPTGTVTASSSNNSDFNATNPCPSCVTGCTINFVTNGGSVPANQHVVVFTSRNLNYMTYDLTGLCIGGEIYVLVANAIPGSGQFANWSGANCSGCNPTSGDPLRTLNVTLTGGCNHDATYSRCQLRNMAGNCGAQDGGAVTFDNGVAQYNNNGCSAPVLPVSFGDFVITKRNDAVGLFWTTYQEVNNDFFTVERSENGYEFEAIGYLKGIGFSDTKQSYHFEDKLPASGFVYYRIKQTDFDGKTGYSEVRFINFEKEDIRVLFTSQNLKITGSEGPFSMTLFSYSGVLLYNRQDMSGDVEYGLENLPAGLYILHVNNGHSSETYKFVR